MSSILGVKRLIFTVVFWATSLNASALWCTGQVPQSLVYATGALTITSEWRANWTQLCNVNVEWKGIPTETCKSWLAIIESAKARNASVTVNYAAGTGDCATLPVYGSAPAPVYVLSDAN